MYYMNEEKKKELAAICKEFNKRISELPTGNGHSLDGGSKEITDLWNWLWCYRRRLLSGSRR